MCVRTQRFKNLLAEISHFYRDGVHLFTTSILICSCYTAPLLLLGLGALFVLFIYCLVWPVIKTLVNGAICSPFLYPNILELVYPGKIYLVLICELWDIFIKLITSFSYLHSW